MKRGYTVHQYRDLVRRIRDIVPEAAIHNDIIVGFPGETAEQFRRTYDLLADLAFDKVHIARYSPRPGTVSARRMTDDVPDSEKRRRFHEIDALQKGISEKIMAGYLGKTVQVLVEDKHKGRWRGRTPQGKLVFFDDDVERRAELVDIQITYTGPWSMSGSPVGAPKARDAKGMSIPLNVL
jgi:tRNA-2-methylthio-N6-dimethylallyladenosine synthase